MNVTQKPLALVTGATRGIGACIALRLAQEGFHTFVNFAEFPGSEGKNEQDANAVRDAILKAGGSAQTIDFDVTKAQQVDEKMDWIHKNHGPLAVLVNNAGITIDSLLIRMRDEDLAKTLDVDLVGAIYCTRAAARQMMRAKTGSIVQISSVVGESGNAGQGAYAAAKAGLIGFSKSIAKELGSRQIRVNVVTPGFITTPMTENLTESQKEAILRAVPLGLMGAPEDVASLVAFLASSASRYITGQVIGVNGGMYM